MSFTGSTSENWRAAWIESTIAAIAARVAIVELLEVVAPESVRMIEPAAPDNAEAARAVLFALLAQPIIEAHCEDFAEELTVARTATAMRDLGFFITEPARVQAIIEAECDFVGAAMADLAEYRLGLASTGDVLAAAHAALCLFRDFAALENGILTHPSARTEA